MLIRGLGLLLFLTFGMSAGQAIAANKKQPPRKTVAKVVVQAKAKHSVQRVAMRQPARGRRYVAPPPEVFNPDLLEVHSTASLVINAADGTVIHEKNIQGVSSIDRKSTRLNSSHRT